MGTRRTKPTKAASRQQPRALVVQNRYPTAISKPMEDAHHTVSHRHNEHHHHLRRQHINTTRHATSYNNRELQPFRFLDLPKDIRLLIYENLPKKTTHQLCTPDSVIAISDHTFPPAILSTCRLIYAEASPVLFNAIRHDGPRLAVAFQGLRIDRLLDVLCVLAPNTARLKWEKRGESREHEQHERLQREQYYHHHQQRHCSTSSTSSTSSSFSSYPSTPTSPTTPTSRTPPVNLASTPLRPQNFDLRCYMRTPKDHTVHINWAPNPTMSSQLTEQQFLARFVKDLGRFYCLVSNYEWTVSLQVGVGAGAGDGGGGSDEGDGDGEYDQLVPLETFLGSRITGFGDEFQERLIADGLVTWWDILNRGGRVRHVSRWLWNRM